MSSDPLENTCHSSDFSSSDHSAKFQTRGFSRSFTPDWFFSPGRRREETLLTRYSESNTDSGVNEFFIPGQNETKLIYTPRKPIGTSLHTHLLCGDWKSCKAHPSGGLGAILSTYLLPEGEKAVEDYTVEYPQRLALRTKPPLKSCTKRKLDDKEFPKVSKRKAPATCFIVY